MGFWKNLLGVKPATPEERQRRWREEAKLELKDQPLVDRMAGIPPETVDMGPQLGILPLYDPMSPEGQDVLRSVYEQNPTYPRWKVNNAYSRRFMEVYRNQNPPAPGETVRKLTKGSKMRAERGKILDHMPQNMSTERKRGQWDKQMREGPVIDAYQDSPTALPVGGLKSLFRK